MQGVEAAVYVSMAEEDLYKESGGNSLCEHAEEEEWSKEVRAAVFVSMADRRAI
jgi:hypothetical protein